MTISTQLGDDGKTQVITGGRVWKDDPRVAACGELDELGSWLGVVASFMPAQHAGQRDRIELVQRELFAVGAVLQAAGFDLFGNRTFDTARLDAWVREFEASLPRLRGFVIQGGRPATAFAHVARTVCRRVERTLTSLLRMAETDDAAARLQLVGVHLNRLADWLFLLAEFLETQNPKDPE
ncbi:MAG: cob(I)yrinic acid a,c-diamide adenosyltransferase [Kiritimatiellaeota bacterium]|nr:cob(I)yrinic acid a,c-diamide adenosyltransferase [Kiritimatiellota bacterium]